MENFSEFIAKHEGKKLAIGMHRNADLDALCSAYALKTVFPQATIITPNEMSSPAKNLAKHLNISIKLFSEEKKELYDGIIIVDSASYALIPDAKGWNILAHIDHHQCPPEEEKIIAKSEFVDSNSPSTCQIIAKILPEINESAAFALAIGMVSDTARFKSANKETFALLAKLMEKANKEYNEILEYAEPERAVDEKVGILSAFRKADFIVYRDIVIATTIVSANESDASSSLSEFADVAFAASWRVQEKETRVSARARKNVQIKMNEILAEIGKRFSGTGGGHHKAAGANAKERPEVVLATCVDAVKDALDALATNKF